MAEQLHSFMKSIFFGNLLEELLFPYPGLESEQSDIVTLLNENLVRWSKENFDSSLADEQGSYPDGTLEALSEMGIMGMIVPEEYGGLELNQVSYAQIFETLAQIDGSLPVTVGGHSSIGMKGLLLYGTDEQKAKYLPSLASGEKIAAFALTEPGSGSDAASIQTRAIRQDDGSWKLSGQKLWITNGGIAQFITVFAKTEIDINGELKDKISAFIVEGDAEGLSRGPEEHKLGIKATSTVPLYFDDVTLPKDALLGEPGNGFKIAMNILNSGRLGLAAGAVGNAKGLLGVAAKHSRARKQFGKSVGKYELIQEKLARMAVNIYVAESMVYLTASYADSDDVDYSVESAICKIFASERCWEVVNDGLQIMGGLGYMKEYPFERALRDSRINMIFEGTNEILRLFIALAGMQAPGEYLKQVGNAFRDPIKRFGFLMDYAMSRVKETVSASHLENVDPALAPWADQFSKSVERFHKAVDSAIIKFGKRIVDRQLMLQRIADSAIEIYAMAAILARATARINQVGVNKAQADIDMVRIYCSSAHQRVKRNIRMIRKHEDRSIRRLARTVYKSKGYPIHN